MMSIGPSGGARRGLRPGSLREVGKRRIRDAVEEGRVEWETIHVRGEEDDLPGGTKPHLLSYVEGHRAYDQNTAHTIIKGPRDKLLFKRSALVSIFRVRAV